MSKAKVAVKWEQNKFIYYVEREQLRQSQDRKAGLKENFAIKREQRQARLDSAEREQSQDRKAGLKERQERRKEKEEMRKG